MTGQIPVTFCLFEYEGACCHLSFFPGHDEFRLTGILVDGFFNDGKAVPGIKRNAFPFSLYTLSSSLGSILHELKKSPAITFALIARVNEQSGQGMLNGRYKAYRGARFL